MTTTEASIEIIATLAPQIASAHEAQSAAFDEQKAAEAALLSRVVELARPALLALSSKILTYERIFWPTNCSTDVEKRYADERGVRIHGKRSDPERDYPRANDGAYEGFALYLTTKGEFLEKTWAGYWTNWQGRTSEGTATLTPLTPAEVASAYEVDDLIATIATKLQEQAAGDSGKTTEAAKARAAKMQAVVAILS